MRNRARILTVCLLAIFVLAGSAIGFAQTGANDKGKETSGAAHARNEARAAEREAAKEAKQDEQGSENERKLNHGFYVAKAAQCEDVDGFTAPADCEDNGKAHGEYVSSVAHSSLGKSGEAHGPKNK